MKKLIIVTAIILGLAATFWAQSGRKNNTGAASTPAPPAPTEKADDYSESAPSKTRAIYAKPKRNDAKNKTKKKGENPAINPANTPAPTAVPNNGQNADGDEEVLKIETNLVTVPVSVYERNGLYVSSLRRSDFKVFENGVEQEVAYFGTSDQPFTVILLLDTSPSTAYKIEDIQSAANAFVSQLKPEDGVMVIEFNLSVNVLSELTNDREKISRAISRTGFGGGTSLYDAVDFSLRKRLAKIEGRKAVVLFTDGVDTTSRSSNFDKSLGEAEESDAVIFPIYFNTYLASRGIGQGGAMSTPAILGLPGGGQQQGPTSADYARGRTYLETLADLTGGRVFRPEATPGGLNAAFAGIAEELRSQYSIGFYPQQDSETGTRRQIRVRVNRPNVAVRARDSYVVGEQQSSPKQPAQKSN